MKVTLHFKEWKLNQFVSDTATMETLQKTFPSAIKIEIVKDFYQLSHGNNNRISA